MDTTVILAFISSFLTSILGIPFFELAKPIIAGLIAATATHKYVECRNNKEIKSTKCRLACAFWAEISALFNIYEFFKLKPWENINDNFELGMLNIEYDYISIFNSNADKIGIFPSEDATQFVEFYLFTKAYIDTLRELSRRYLKHVERYEQYVRDPNNKNVEYLWQAGIKDLFELYNLCYEQQSEFYHRRDEVRKTFEKYL